MVRLNRALIVLVLGGASCASPTVRESASPTFGCELDPDSAGGAGVAAWPDPAVLRADPAEFVHGNANAYFPLAVGTEWVYQGVVDGHHERIELVVTPRTRPILGVETIGVRDVNFVDGELSARTTDWYAHDAEGNVWYFGERTQNFERGRPTDTEGWEAGVDGASPGIFMLADPTVGAAYRQNHQTGVVENLAEVVCLNASRTIDGRDYRGLIVVRGWSPLEPEVVELKYYAAGIGKVFELLTSGGSGGTELVRHRSATSPSTSKEGDPCSASS